MVTAGTHAKQAFLNTPARLDFFRDALFSCAREFCWQLRAWAILSNHYHFLAASPPDASNLKKMLGKLHMTTAKQLNLWDRTPGRKVWFQYWDTHITFEPSNLARLNYIHQNPVKHGIVRSAEDYAWCSAAWFAENASPAFVKTVAGFKTDRLGIVDDF